LYITHKGVLGLTINQYANYLWQLCGGEGLIVVPSGKVTIHKFKQGHINKYIKEKTPHKAIFHTSLPMSPFGMKYLPKECDHIFLMQLRNSLFLKGM
jgi:hypothetical protein